MAIKVMCVCGHQLKVPDSAAGKRGKCPMCDQSVQVPASASEELETDEPETFSHKAPAVARSKKPKVANVKTLDDDDEPIDSGKKTKTKRRSGSTGGMDRHIRCPKCRTSFTQPFKGTRGQLISKKIAWLFIDGPWQHCPKCRNHFDVKSLSAPLLGLATSVGLFWLLRRFGRGLVVDAIASAASFKPDVPDLWGAEILVTPFFVGLRGGFTGLLIALMSAFLVLVLVTFAFILLGWGGYRVYYATIQRI